MSKNMKLSLKADTFQSLQEDFDAVLGRTLTNMETKGADDATITIKLKVGLEKSTARDYLANGYDGVRDIMKPTFTHEIASVMQIKDKKTGSLAGDYELVYDTETGKYFMRRVDDGQVQMDGYEDEDYEVVEGEIAGLPEPKEEPSPFEWMKQFAGKTVIISEAYDVVTVRTMDGAIILSSGCEETSSCYCPADVLRPHIGHNAQCIGYSSSQDDEIDEITIECDECPDVLYSIKKPEPDVEVIDGDTVEENGDTVSDSDDYENLEESDAEEGYEYDTPDEEE